jgi:hypothetical protein
VRIALLLALAACSSSGTGTGTAHDAAVPLDGLSCIATGSGCGGVMCGGTCCATGEACISGVCMCGNQPACTGGNNCVSPIFSMNRCGTVCCGATAACPGVAP